MLAFAADMDSAFHPGLGGDTRRDLGGIRHRGGLSRQLVAGGFGLRGRGLAAARPGIQISTTSAPSSVITAEMTVVTCMACTKAASANVVEAQSRVTQLGGHGLSVAVIEPVAAFLGGGGQGGQVRAELATVDLGQDGAQHGDAQRPGDLAGGVGQRRAGAGPLPGHHGHDRLGGRRHDGAHARALDEEDHAPAPRSAWSMPSSW